MTKCHCNCAVSCLAVLFAIFLALDVITFGATIGLAWYGIDEANNENTCRNVNVTEDCVPFINIMLSGMNSNQIPPYIYWMIGATACGLLWAIFNVATLITLSEMVKVHLGLLAKLEKDAKNIAIELKNLPHHDATGDDSKAAEGTDAGKSTPTQPKPAKPAKPKSELDQFVGPDNIQGFTDHIGGVYTSSEWVNEPLRHFGPLSALSLFISSILFVCAVLCLIWGIAIAFDHTRRDEKSVRFFIIVEILVGVLLPVCLSSSVAFFAVVLEFITIGHADLRTLVPRLVNVVKFQIGQNHDYWVIDNTFYYPLEKKEGRKKKSCWYSVDKEPATWLIAIIIGCAFNLVISYFVDLTLDMQITVNSCTDPLIDRTYDCFEARTLEFVDCIDNTNATLLHCFKFYRFGVETNIITAIATSYAFYLVTVAVLRHIYSVVHTLIHIKPSRYWGVGLVAVGLIFYAVSIIVTVVWIRGYGAGTIGELRRINIIHIAQFFMVSTFVTMTGSLLLRRWYEKLNTKAHGKVVEIPLVHYTDTQRKYIHQIESLDKDQWPPTNDGQGSPNVDTHVANVPPSGGSHPQAQVTHIA